MNRIVLYTLLILSTNAQAQQMTIDVFNPDNSSGISGKNNIVIYLSGQIDSRAANRLKTTLNKLPSSKNGYDFVLNSPGGLVYTGIEIGRYIRSLPKSRTYIGQPHGKLNHNNLAASLRSGSCESACSLAFLGGQQRYIPKSSRYGVHQFYTENLTPRHDDISLAQIATADIVTYLNEMGVDSNLISEMAYTDKNKMRYLTQSQLVQFNVIQSNNKNYSTKVNSPAVSSYRDNLSNFLNSPIKVHFLNPYK